MQKRSKMSVRSVEKVRTFADTRNVLRDFEEMQFKKNAVLG